MRGGLGLAGALLGCLALFAGCAGAQPASQASVTSQIGFSASSAGAPNADGTNAPPAPNPNPPAATATPVPGAPPTSPPVTTASADWQSWLQFGGNGEHSGTVGDGTITAANVGGLRQYWAATVSPQAQSAPVLADAVPVAGGHRAMLFVNQKNGTLAAFDALTGAALWTAGTSGPGWTFSAPAVDPSQAYVYAYGLDGKVHKYNAATGAEDTAGWPVTVTYNPSLEQGSSALSIAFGWLYVAFSGYPGDIGDYIGHVVAINLTSGEVRVWNAICSNETGLLSGSSCGSRGGGIWARAGVVADPQTGHVYVVVGNATFQPGNSWGDSVVALTPDLSTIVDSYTPSNYQNLQNNDLDLGSSAPALLPEINGRLLLVQGGKDGVLRVLDRRNLSGQGGPGHTGGELATFTAPGGCRVSAEPLVYIDGNGGVWVVVTTDCGSAGYRINVTGDGSVVVNQAWSNGQGSTTPVLGNNVAFASWGGKLYAFNPTTGQQLWSAGIGGNYGQSPIVADGRVCVTDDNGGVRCFGP